MYSTYQMVYRRGEPYITRVYREIIILNLKFVIEPPESKCSISLTTIHGHNEPISMTTLYQSSNFLPFVYPDNAYLFACIICTCMV
ncbi:MAG: hypothetical protein MJE68_11040, partial [Proteobacteria bacterium]|nr:hypothetical protein [Pseudomonadota bacterium]